MPVYMIFQPMRCTASRVATETGGLLPRLFTFTSRNSGEGGPSQVLTGSNSLLHFYTLADIYPLGSMALFVARTFLGISRLTGKTPRRDSLLHRKGTKY